MKSWKTLSRKEIHKNPWYSLYHDKVIRPDGSKGSYFVIRKDQAVVVIPWDGKKVYLVNQFRYTLGRRFWELPAGKIERKESTLATAKRELEEEVGIRAKKWSKLGKFAWAPGFADQIGVVYLATGLSKGLAHREDSEADMEARGFSIAEIDKMILRGEIIDAGTIAPWYFFKTYLKNL